MTAEGHKVASLHGAKEGTERDAIIDGFRAGKEKVLITTNVIARGIDILQVNMVVNYDLPMMYERSNASGASHASATEPDVETYIHRIGRTGRFGRKGISINFVHDKRTWDQMAMIEKATGREIKRIETTSVEVMEEVGCCVLFCFFEFYSVLPFPFSFDFDLNFLGCGADLVFFAVCRG